MTIDKPDMLLWMDVETTGLDPDHDRILEVELRCTDMRGVRCVGGFRRDIRQYARIIRHLAAHPVRYVAAEAAR